ncbi:MAG: hypothetical protein KGJ09_08410 [Candidatus Omnitrophica bacterium]|nr:hypothetical protein [Candidatus Omnitrophota bacterium]MDE2010083.1 hypothetical protein [Candidatus Omnitrophota bacterium]MDE2232090.1 hypothetical protein [Candidatus Omnitrophota bacterium]
MRKRGLLLGLLLFVCMAVPRCFAQNQPEQVKTIFSFKNELGITDDQELKLKALLYDEQNFIDGQNNTLKELGAQLNQLIEKNADMAAIKSKLEEMSRIQVDISYRNIEDSRKVAEILTPQQLAQWRSIQKKYSAQAQPK